MTAVSARRIPWRIDFAGRHGTAWGTANVAFAVVNITTLERLVFAAPWWIAASTILGGVFLTLMIAAFRTVAPSAVLYQLACWAGSGGWSAWMLRQPHWTFQSWGEGVLVLAAGALILGLALALGKKDPEPVAVDATAPDPQADTAGQRGAVERAALAQVWIDRIDRLSGNARNPRKPAEDHRPRITISNIEPWVRGGGYTIQGTFTSGAFGLAQLTDLGDKLAQDADLPYGCTVRGIPEPGAGRRAFGLKVTTENALAAPQPFPVDGGPWSINGTPPVGCEADGTPYGLQGARQKNIGVYGMPGSGKTGSMKAVTCTLALTADVVAVAIDATGNDLTKQALAAFEDGRAEFPMLAHVATTYAEAERQQRAMIRVGHARKAAYGYLLQEHNTTLLPIGATVRRADLPPLARARFTHPADHERIVPQIMTISDETREFLSRSGSQWRLGELITKAMRELRGAGVRYMFGPLGAGEAEIAQPIQNLTHLNFAMLLPGPGEYAGVFGSAHRIKPDEFPDKPDGSGKVPGVGFAQAGPGEPVKQIRFWGEMTPTVVDQVAIRASKIGTLPELDYVGELAADGFRPDGTPWPMEPGVMEPGDELFWTTRWDNWDGRKKAVAPDAGTTMAAPAAPAAPKVALSMEELREQTRRANAALTAPDAFDPAEVEEAAKRWPDHVDALTGLPPVVAPSWEEKVMGALEAAPPGGILGHELVRIAGVHRSEVFKLFGKLKAKGLLHQPTRGFYELIRDAR